MKIAALAEAVQILAKYAGDDQECVTAEHDGIWIGNVEWPLTAEEKIRLMQLGFSPHDDMGWHVFT